MTLSVERVTLPPVIDTDRLQLRPWKLTDVDDVLGYAQDPEWSRYLRLLPVPYARGDAEQFLARQLLLDRVVHPSWAVVLQGTVVGGINLRISFDHLLAELGYSIARRHWNRGYGTEAARAVIDAAFEAHADLNRVRAMADARNTASQRVMQKLGMVKEGVLRQNRVERGEAMDEAWWGILRSEWSSRPQPGSR
jgi:[ribosomal protein S5]-alanine N-acetyltransferase